MLGYELGLSYSGFDAFGSRVMKVEVVGVQVMVEVDGAKEVMVGSISGSKLWQSWWLQVYSSCIGRGINVEAFGTTN